MAYSFQLYVVQMLLLRPKGSPTKFWHKSHRLKQPVKLLHQLGLRKKGLWIQKYLRRIHLREPPTSIDPSQIQPTVHVIGKSSDLRLFTQFACVPWETYALQLTRKQLAVRSYNLKHQEMPHAESVGFHRQYSSSLLLPCYLRQLQHLVLHQGDKRTDDNSCISSVNRRKLVAQAFSIALKKRGRSETSCFLCSYNIQL